MNPLTEQEVAEELERYKPAKVSYTTGSEPYVVWSWEWVEGGGDKWDGYVSEEVFAALTDGDLYDGFARDYPTAEAAYADLAQALRHAA